MRRLFCWKALARLTASTVLARHLQLASNVAAGIFGEFVVAIDAGLRPQASQPFREALERTYLRPVKLVCVTHDHADHTFGLSSFKDCTIVGSIHLTGLLRKARTGSRTGVPDGAPPRLTGKTGSTASSGYLQACCLRTISG